MPPQGESALTQRRLLEIVNELKLPSSLPVSLVGCRAGDRPHQPCEFDLLVPGLSSPQPVLCQVNGLTAELIPAPSSPSALLRAYAPFLAKAVSIRDREMVMASVLLEAREDVRWITGWAKRRLEQAILCFGSGLGSLTRGDAPSTKLWFMASIYLGAEATVVVGGTIPSPSHLLTFVKEKPGSFPKGIAALWSESLDIEYADKRTIQRRLTGLARLLERQRGVEEASKIADLVKAKARYMLGRGMGAEAYSYLGYEVVKALGLLGLRAPPKSPRGLFRVAPASSTLKLLISGQETSELVSQADQLRKALQQAATLI